MPRTTRRPLDERARARLREAQRLESDAVTEVLAAAINREGTQSKLDAVIAKYQVAISEADNALNKAHKHLVCPASSAPRFYSKNLVVDSIAFHRHHRQSA